jgi:protein-S-isoprenylcysteine O-methyltransferase Ste14
MRLERVLPHFTDAIFALLAVYLVLNYLRSLLMSPGTLFSFVSRTLFVTYLLIALVLLAGRKKATAYSSRLRDYAYTLLGLGSPLLYQPALHSYTEAAGETLAFVGIVLVLGAFLSLNRSFGLAPENRGVRTTGVYRIVRHPMYLGYILGEAGFVYDNLSIPNLLILAVSVLFLLLRLRAEERFLQQDPNYRAYTRKTRWRLIPFVF